MAGTWYHHEIRVRYQETDQMGVVYHANYLTWFEMGRTEWIRAFGHTYEEIERRGLLLPVTDLEISYKRAARYDDIVTIWTRLAAMSHVRLEYDFKITREDELLVKGKTKHVWVGKDFKPARIDKKAPDLYALLTNHVSEEA
ncbi:acyl-CoA thioesterase [Marinicrinis sediminis]|uniref:Acyl-CoA thioesterase n=1 Tax=Marinicrinis sediminis TaxID=1652465 RepID=A0ABW5R9B9_9BACL